MNTLFRCILGLIIPAALLGTIVVVAAPSDAQASAHRAPPTGAPLLTLSGTEKEPFVADPVPWHTPPKLGIREDPRADRGVSHTAPPFFDPLPPGLRNPPGLRTGQQ